MGLIPRDEKYFTMLNELVSEIRKGADTFVSLFNDFPKHSAYAEQIKKTEVECDRKSAGIIDRLNTSFITPIDREDLFMLTTELDDIMDKINEMSREITLLNIQKPTPDAIELARILRDSVAELEVTFPLLEKRADVRDHIQKIKSLEEDGDQASQNAIRKLFAEEQNPIEVVKWLRIYDQMEAGIDRCKDVANVLETIVMKNA